MTDKITSYKGFKPDLKCRDYQFEIGKTFKHEGEVKKCHTGFHACEYPLNVFDFYAPATSRFALVEQSGVLDNGGDKVASSIIEIKAELSIGALIKAAIDFTMSRTTKSEGSSSTGYQGAASSTGTRGAASSTGTRGAASSTGYQGAASSTGYQGAASSTGTRGAASSTGDQGAASSTGYQGAASSTGYQGAASSTGYQGAASSTGDQGAASSTGYQGAASSTGYQGAAFSNGWEGSAESTGEKSVAVGVGYQNKGRVSKGNWLVLAYRDSDQVVKHISSAKAGGIKGIKPDVWYTLSSKGKFVEVKP